jgi:purine-cytosine permease-like protein
MRHWPFLIAMRWILSTVLGILGICVPMLFGPISELSGRRAAYIVGTLLLAASTAALTKTCHHERSEGQNGEPRHDRGEQRDSRRWSALRTTGTAAPF